MGLNCDQGCQATNMKMNLDMARMLLSDIQGHVTGLANNTQLTMDPSSFRMTGLWIRCQTGMVLTKNRHCGKRPWWRHQMETFSALLARIHRSPVSSPHKGQWRGALMFSLICAWINDWVNNREAGDLRRHCAHYDAIVMIGDGPNSQIPECICCTCWAHTQNDPWNVVGRPVKLYPILVHILKPEPSGWHLADDIIKCTMWNDFLLFWLDFHWDLFLRAHVTVVPSGFGQRPGVKQATDHKMT